ncbi:hypothetical protein OS493_022455, partial [Desmophyllum pertusum]
SPTITLSPDSKGIDESDPVTLQCEAKGYPPPKLKWLKLLGNRVIGEGNFLFIANVQRSDQGRYRCIATNGFGDDATAEFKINVYYAPVINKTASSQNVPAWAGTTTDLACIADGNPAPRYTWTNPSGTVATSEENGILRVTPQGNNGFGQYTCTVENNKGKDYLNVSLVKVDKPVVKLEAYSRSAFDLSFKWLLLSSDSSNYFLEYYTLQYRTVDSKISNVYIISPKTTEYQLTNLQPYTRYIVELYATNKHFISAPSRVEVMTTEAEPGPPGNVKANVINSTTIHVTWTPPLKPNGPLKLYTVFYDETEGFVLASAQRKSVLPNITEYFIGGLNPFTNYTVIVNVENSIAFKRSSAVTVITKPSVPAAAEIYDLPSEVINDTITLKWREPKGNGKVITLYTVYQRIVTDGKQGEWTRLKTITDISVRELKVKLEKGKVYEFVVTATNELGESLKEDGKIKRVKASGIPAAVEMSDIPSEVTDSTITLKWSEPQSYGKEIIQYTVYQRIVTDGKSGEWGELKNITDVSVRELKVQLMKGKENNFVVTATNVHGESIIEEGKIKRVKAIEAIGGMLH